MKAIHDTEKRSRVRMWLADERGATAIEYGLIAGLLAIALIGGATALGDALNTKFDDGATALDNSIS